MESIGPELWFGGYFERRDFIKDKPHIMICLKHEVAHDERLFRAEVLAILAAIQSRMSCPEFEENIIFPVMVFSFMGYYARIIQAYHNGDKLIIHKSRAFEFRDAETAPTALFVRYMSSTPVGGKTLLPRLRPAKSSLSMTIRSITRDLRRAKIPEDFRSPKDPREKKKSVGPDADEPEV
ncbi:uncharacterized protein TRUGW13939_03882 [Talaromyces rugulosus]|uniref:Uncharacterized protein n=1 Tax=Talaromyces rugulosus TaxID=121627 RepID=A0A7H8QTH0_TALRU|nr:uncharacterized protein TRUGW13939_03882 [Talaromyces rugulosus]QKX56775.1 hypothetical protein TRUGW13939_03882 [Talaromyces rugulosus]